MPSEQNSYGGGGGLPIVFLFIRYTVIKETYYSLTTIGGLQPPSPLVPMGLLYADVERSSGIMLCNLL